MQGKYTHPLHYRLAQARRLPLRLSLRLAAGWSPMREPQEGYTIILGNYAPLSEILLANFELLRRQDLTDCREIIVVSDRPRGQVDPPIEDLARRQFPDLPLNFLYYGPLAWRYFRQIGSAYTYCWKSWCTAIAHCRTRYALIHDMDAMLLRRDILRQRHDHIRTSGAHYVGVNVYQGNGVLRSDNLVTTWELMFDVEFVRAQFKPVDLFNAVTTHNGRTVDFDCFLLAQSRKGINEALPIDENDMVHPSQVITQYTDLLNVRGYVPPANNNLLMIPYFYYLAGRPEPLQRLTGAAQDNPSARSFPMMGRPMDLSRLSITHLAWVRKQALRLERAVVGDPREPVLRYFDALAAVVETRESRATQPAPALVGSGA